MKESQQFTCLFSYPPSPPSVFFSWIYSYLIAITLAPLHYWPLFFFHSFLFLFPLPKEHLAWCASSLPQHPEKWCQPRDGAVLLAHPHPNSISLLLPLQSTFRQICSFTFHFFKPTVPPPMNIYLPLLSVIPVLITSLKCLVFSFCSYPQ